MMTIKPATLINLNSPPLLEGSEATTFTFQNIDGVLHIYKVENLLFRNNLILVDGLLPEILGEVLIYAYTNNCIEVATVVEAIEKINPLKFGTKYEVKFYTYKIKEFLRNLALGMNAKEVWNGPQCIYDHFPVLKHENELLYYSDARFIQILFEKAKLKISQAQDEKPYIGLTLQIEL